MATLPFDETGIDVHWIGEAPCVAVLRADHVLAGRRVLRLRDLRKRRLLTLASRLRRRIDRVLQQADVEVSDIIETNASSAALAMARAGSGIAIVEPATAYGLPLEGLAVPRPLNTVIPFLVGAFAPAGKPMSPSLAALNDALLEAASAMLPGFQATVPSIVASQRRKRMSGTAPIGLPRSSSACAPTSNGSSSRPSPGSRPASSTGSACAT